MLYMGKDKFENEVRSHSSVYILFVNKRAFASAVGVRLSELSELEHLSNGHVYLFFSLEHMCNLEVGVNLF